VEGDEDHRLRPRPGNPGRRLTRREGAGAAQRGRIVVGRGQQVAAPVVRRQQPPRACEVDAELADGVALLRERGGDRGSRTIETSCSAEAR
jgi:hypothetical protein